MGPSAPPPLSIGCVERVRRARVLALAAAAVVPVAVIWPGSRPEPRHASSSTVSASAASPKLVASREPTEQTTTTPLSSSDPSIRSLQGLAVAWLHGYLTRSSRDEDRWEAATADLSSPELLAELRESRPNSVGLDPFSSWRVAKIEANPAVDPPVDTPSRKTLAYAAFVIDGHRTAKKPITLYSNRQAADRWLVTVADQRYASEG